jgi:hypothetical protein
MHFMHTACGILKNLSLREEGKVLDCALEIAHSQSTLINAFLCGFLDDLVRQETMKDKARKELLKLCQCSSAVVGDAKWSLDSLNERSSRIVRSWVRLFNDGGVDALITKPRPGRPPKVKT